MSLHIYNPSDRYRQRKKNKFMSLMGRVGLIVLAAMFGYWIAGQGDVRKVANLKAQNELLQGERAQLQDALMELKSSERTAKMRYKQIQESAEGILNDPDLQDIVGLVRRQLDKGMSADRLKFAVRSAKPPSNCTDAKVQRFVVSTPNYNGEKSELVLADGAVKITGDGRSAAGDKNKPEAWFDPKKPVDLLFTVTPPAIDGVAQDVVAKKKRGTLPLYHTAVIGDRQYRFTVSEGAQSFAKVTFDSCDHP